MSTTTTTTAARDLDVLVIGGGQAGLAMGYHLQQTRLRYRIVERNERLGESWRTRFDSLTLFTPRAYSALPGMPVSGDPDGYPTKDEIADYLEVYAARFGLPLTLGTGIERLERVDDVFRATTTTGDILTARSVVIATGAFQQPAIPPIAQGFEDDVVQLTPNTYRNPAVTPARTVLIVGDGASGRQIARELSDTHRVLLAAGHPRRVSKERILRKHLFWWLDRVGALRKSKETRLGRRLKQIDSFPGTGLDLPDLRERGITVVGRLINAAGRTVAFAGGESIDVDVVVWATGYRDQTDWVAIPEVKDASGAFIEQRGISPLPGLTFIGRSWQWTRGSALLTGVGADAKYVTQHLVQILAAMRDTGTTIGTPKPVVLVPQPKPRKDVLDPTG
jgi:putative flavoprotein involved in K+ transport